MKAFLIIMALFLSSTGLANQQEISNYIFYRTNANYKDKDINCAYYMIKSDPCLYFNDFTSDKTTRYCKLNNTIDLRNTGVVLNQVTNDAVCDITFYVTSKKIERRCKIDTYMNTIKCFTKNQQKTRLEKFGVKLED